MFIYLHVDHLNDIIYLDVYVYRVNEMSFLVLDDLSLFIYNC